jgi:modification methylase
MSSALKATEKQAAQDQQLSEGVDLARFVPAEVYPLDNPQTDIPRIAKDESLVQLIEAAVRRVPTTHSLNLGDARGMNDLASGSVQLVITSPPYWTLKQYRDRR